MDKIKLNFLVIKNKLKNLKIEKQVFKLENQAATLHRPMINLEGLGIPRRSCTGRPPTVKVPVAGPARPCRTLL